MRLLGIFTQRSNARRCLLIIVRDEIRAAICIYSASDLVYLLVSNGLSIHLQWVSVRPPVKNQGGAALTRPSSRIWLFKHALEIFNWNISVIDVKVLMLFTEIPVPWIVLNEKEGQKLQLSTFFFLRWKCEPEGQVEGANIITTSTSQSFDGAAAQGACMNLK